MKIKNNNPLDLEAAPGERLSLTMEDPGGIAVVSYTSPAGQGQLVPGAAHSFTVPPPHGNQPVLVGIACTFKAGGVCGVCLTDEGGRQAPYSFSSAFGLGANAVVYAIDVR